MLGICELIKTRCRTTKDNIKIKTSTLSGKIAFGIYVIIVIYTCVCGILNIHSTQFHYVYLGIFLYPILSIFLIFYTFRKTVKKLIEKTLTFTLLSALGIALTFMSDTSAYKDFYTIFHISPLYSKEVVSFITKYILIQRLSLILIGPMAILAAYLFYQSSSKTISFLHAILTMKSNFHSRVERRNTIPLREISPERLCVL